MIMVFVKIVIDVLCSFKDLLNWGSMHYDPEGIPGECGTREKVFYRIWNRSKADRSKFQDKKRHEVAHESLSMDKDSNQKLRLGLCDFNHLRCKN